MSRSASLSSSFGAWVAAAMFALAGGPTFAGSHVPSAVDTALARLFPPPAAVLRDSLFLTEEQARAAVAEAGADLPSRIVTRYLARLPEDDRGTVVATAYVDTHRVRTVSETLLIVVDPAGRVSRIEVLAFEEPREYLPREPWLEQFNGRGLGADLQIKRAIRTLAGATLSSRAVTEAVRRVLAVHRAVERRPAEAP